MDNRAARDTTMLIQLNDKWRGEDHGGAVFTCVHVDDENATVVMYRVKDNGYSEALAVDTDPREEWTWTLLERDGAPVYVEFAYYVLRYADGRADAVRYVAGYFYGTDRSGQTSALEPERVRGDSTIERLELD